MRDYTVTGLVDRVRAHPGFLDLARRLSRVHPGNTPAHLAFPEAAWAPVVGALAHTIAAPVLWITAHPDEARVVAEALEAYVRLPDRVRLFPAPDAMPFERIPWDPGTREHRLAALAALFRWQPDMAPGTAPVIVASLRGLMTCTLPPAAFSTDARVVRVGDRLGLTAVRRQIARLGYETVTTVNEPGQVAHRGGIVDLFPACDPAPTRIEWLGDEIESLRRFDPVSQRSQGTVPDLVLVPASEALPHAGGAVAAQIERLALRRLHPIAESELRRHAEHLAVGESFPGIELYTTLLHPERATVLDYLADQAWVVFDRVDLLGPTAQSVLDQAATVLAEQVAGGELPPDWPARPLASWSELTAGLQRLRQVHLGHPAGEGDPGEGLAAAFGAPPRFAGQIEEAVVAAARLSEAGNAVVVVTRQAPRFCELLSDVGVSVAPAAHLERAPGGGGIAVVHGALGVGWTLAEDGQDTVVLTDSEIFGWRMPHRRRRERSRDGGRPTEYFAELSPGDYVVHIEHGIGHFCGLTRLQVDGVEREYLQIEYAQGDMLYVPTHQADRVARYVGPGDLQPQVTRLGTADWERAKQRARRAVEDIARELLALYARREVARRTPFSPDTPWQAEMEAAFPYLETEDQLRAIEAVKRDMESEKPMDRLVVGDVGFGKTEVALRAAFKAVMGGKQVAVLAPTTVLAQQHYDTFRRRMAPFPVRVEMLSRFRGRAGQAEALDRLATREIDIVVGTHRLLSADVQFKDLGLLIVDEEHRFGVKHKERLRELRQGIDTLTLTATPIPRTMHMALSGLRDLTTIDTPPEERLPVVTHVGPYDENLVRQAIRRELARRGQVFYVHNRVQGIELVAQKVRRLVPEARLDVAHGQMTETALAQAMLDFVGGATDVLVCTSIIESGLDIPNANTLIVDRADRFGLAQLHQLRGRVGRSHQRAYAYLMHPPGYELAPDARQRLAAVIENTALGSGFRLAMRDLEIRGAGEILGARQHGQVAAIGLDLYTRLLAAAINRLQADSPTLPEDVSRELAAVDPGSLPTVDLPLDAYLPESYVSETGERTRLYRRMAVIDTVADVEDLQRELLDRFGPPPTEVANLVAVLRLRVLAHLTNARSVGYEGGRAVIRWREDHTLDRAPLKSILDRGARIGRHQVSLPVLGPPDTWLPRLQHALERMVPVEGQGGGAGVTSTRLSS